MPVNILDYAPEWVKEFKRCEQYIEAALEHAHGTFTINSVFEDLINGHAILWPGENSAIVTQTIDYPSKKILHLFLAGGNLLDLQGLYKEVEVYAKSIGCQGITLTGRPGWAKSFLIDEDFKVREVQMYKEI